MEFPPQTRILVVGAGGIGCELLKTLAQTRGNPDVTVVDLDTIDVSNLNRQFLFRRAHVGKSKAEVAAEAVRALNPDMPIVAHHGNIKEERFGRSFFEKFTLVLNALDNVNARTHVNRLCLAAGKPLIDAGTAGYLGQAQVMFRGEAQCYDCTPKKEGTRFPICTIRSTPDKPVHCIVWAKELFKLLFGARAESDLVDFTAGGEAPPETADEAARVDFDSKSAVMKAVLSLDPSAPEAADAASVEAYARRVFDAVFDEEIRLKLAMRDGYKTAKFRPEPLSFDKASGETTADASASASAAMLASQRLWSVAECASHFVRTVREMFATPDARAKIGTAVFDKDDPVAMDFVTAASNLRCRVFGIERKSPFDVKGIAGNIIHAIATTNAIAAGLQVLEAVRVANRLLPERKEPITSSSFFTWIHRHPAGNGSLLQPTELAKPNPKCVACGRAKFFLAIDTTKATLGDVLTKVLKGKLGVNLPSIVLGASGIYESGDDLDEDEKRRYDEIAARVLVDCPGGGVKDGASLSVSDFSQDLEFSLEVKHVPSAELEQVGDGFLLGPDAESIVVPASAASAAAAAATPQPPTENGEDVVVADEADDRQAKRARVA